MYLFVITKVNYIHLQVRHSQRLSETPLKCWIVTEESGEVCCAHCNCMAGLGETCTHIAAILFYLEAAHRFVEVKTCTQGACEWNVPTLKTVEYLPTKLIDFTSARGKKRKLDDMLEGCETQTDEVTVKQGSKPTDDEMALFFRNLSMCNTKPAVLSLIPEYSDNYVVMSTSRSLPLTALLKPEYLALDYHDLLNVCEGVTVDITNETAQVIEQETRLQSKSKLWYKYRAGRVTASRMKAVCHTNLSNPSQSLIKSVCYPEAFSFISKQTDWGCKHETEARKMYERISKAHHKDFKVIENGLFINPQWPFIGESPDGIISCQCCTRGVLEIKCPYCHREESVELAAANDKKFCLKESNGSLYLDHSHPYFYQVQTQIFVCNVLYCDFCVCTFATGEDEQSVHTERIYRNAEFWNDCVSKANCFFRTCILPELMGNWYTRPSITIINEDQRSQNEPDEFQQQSHQPERDASSSQHNNSNHPLQTFCYCKGPDTGKMIACDNNECVIEWFHLDCLKIDEKSIPKGKWYCPDCRKMTKFGKRTKKNKAKKL